MGYKLNLIDNNDWLSHINPTEEFTAHLLIFDQEVIAVQLSYFDYINSIGKSMANGGGINKIAQANVFHQAKIFVSSVRRVGRLAESMSANSNIFGDASSSIKTAWRKKKSRFDSYIEPRNAIEHIDGELSGKTNWRFMNISNNVLQITDDTKHNAEISEDIVNMVLSIRNEIVEAVVKAHT